MLANWIQLLALACAAPRATTQVQLTVVLVDPQGRDVTQAAADQNDRSVQLSICPAGEGRGPDIYAELGSAQPIEVPEDEPLRIILWSVAFPSMKSRPYHRLELAPGWAVAGAACPEIVLKPGATGSRQLALRVARTRPIDLTWALPEDVSETDDLRVAGALALESGVPQGFEFLDDGPPQRSVRVRRMGLPPGRYALWGNSWFRFRPGPRLWAHEDIEVVDREELQSFVVHLRRGVEITGRLVTTKGVPISERQCLGLTVPALVCECGGGGSIGSSYSSLWTLASDKDGRFRLQGMPPGTELVLDGAPRGTLRFRVREQGGDVGDLVVE